MKLFTLGTACVGAFCAASVASAGQAVVPASADNTLYAESGAASNGAGSFLFAGMNSQSAVRRALLRFDVAAAIPPGATIQSASLQLSLSQAASGLETLTLHRALASWGEGTSDAPGSEGAGTAASANDATWTMRFFGPSTAWTSTGGDFEPAPSATLAVDGVATWSWSSPALAADVQHWLDVPADAHGWILRGNETTAGTAKRFESRQSATANLVPRLVVDYALGCPPPASACPTSPNSVGAGALIAFIGSASVSASDATLTVSGAPANASGLFLFGAPAAPVVLGNGTLCAGGYLRRFGVQTTDALGRARKPIDFYEYPADSLTPGTEVVFHFWYRDPAAGGANVNLSDGIRVRFCP